MKKEKGLVVYLDDPRIEREGDQYVAYQDQLKLMGCGFTKKDAESELMQVASCSLKALAKEGILLETLDNKGIHYNIIEQKKTENKYGCKPLVLDSLELVGA